MDQDRLSLRQAAVAARPEYVGVTRRAAARDAGDCISSLRAHDPETWGPFRIRSCADTDNEIAPRSRPHPPRPQTGMRAAGLPQGRPHLFLGIPVRHVIASLKRVYARLRRAMAKQSKL